MTHEQKRLELFQKMAQAIWGDRWCMPASRAFGVHYRTLMRWNSGCRRVPDDVFMTLGRMLNEHREHIAGLIVEAKLWGMARA